MFSTIINCFTHTKPLIQPKWALTILTNGYAAPASGALGKLKKGKKSATASSKILLPVETDVKKLVTFVCGSNILKEGGQDVELKPDSEYPEWLWNIRTGAPPKLEELDPNTKAYWRKLRKQTWNRNNLMSSHRRF